MKTITFSFPGTVGYTDPYTIVAYTASNPTVPAGMVVISEYGSTVSGTIPDLPTDASYTIYIYTDTCADPVGSLIIYA